MTWHQSASHADIPPSALTAADVARMYETLLGRTPAHDEVAQQMAATSDWRLLLEAVTLSPEFRARHQNSVAASANRAPAVVNFWHPDLGGYSHASGTWSTDGEAVVGTEGWIYLARGTNSVLSQYEPDFALPPRWGEEWTEAVQARVSEASTLGASLAMLVVPDKLSVLDDYLPRGIALTNVPPGLRLTTELGLPILYPVAALSQVPGGAYLRTDTHLSLAGNMALASMVLGTISDPRHPVVDVSESATTYLSAGDLGRRFEPAVVEVMSAFASLGRATLTDDNLTSVQATGRHLGSRRVLRNETAEDSRTVVIFGDSYSVPTANYHGLAWFLAQHFAETHFVWSPFGWDLEYAANVGAGVVVCEMAERFVPRPPDVRFDVATLVANAVRTSE